MKMRLRRKIILYFALFLAVSFFYIEQQAITTGNSRKRSLRHEPMSYITKHTFKKDNRPTNRPWSLKKGQDNQSGLVHDHFLYKQQTMIEPTFMPRNRSENNQKENVANEKIFQMKEKKYSHAKDERHINKIFKILITGFWTTFDKGSKFMNEIDGFSKCNYKNCKIVSSDLDNWTPDMVKDVHAVVMNVWNTYYLPVRLQLRSSSKNTLMIFYTHEAPCRPHWYNLTQKTSKTTKRKKFDDLFDIVASYNKHSDIYIPYGKIQARQYSKSVDINYIERTKSADKVAVWIASNCVTLTRRQAYVEELEKYMEVDIFGKCFPNKKMDCRKTLPFRYDLCVASTISKYRFYLAFENSLADDYVTEKAFLALKHFVIPVVLGGANYGDILPPHSYINVNQFNSPTDLAKYLSYLLKNQTAFMEYFKWHEDKYILYPIPRECAICEYFNLNYHPETLFYNITKGKRSSRQRLQISNTFGRNETCKNVDNFYSSHWREKTWTEEEKRKMYPIH